MRWRDKASWLPLAAVALLAVALFVPARALLRCAGDGVARETCCCAERAGGASQANASIGQSCYCDTVTVGPTTKSDVVAPRVFDFHPAPPATIAVLSTESSPPPTLISDLAARPVRPPGVPVFVLKRAFLI
jgi:hypothetical protein